MIEYSARLVYISVQHQGSSNDSPFSYKNITLIFMIHLFVFSFNFWLLNNGVVYLLHTVRQLPGIYKICPAAATLPALLIQSRVDWQKNDMDLMHLMMLRMKTQPIIVPFLRQSNLIMYLVGLLYMLLGNLITDDTWMQCQDDVK